MELLLSSYVLDDVGRPAMLPPSVEGRAGIILNALDQYGPSRDRNLDREEKTLASWGYSCEELDLRSYFTTPEALAARLSTLNMVWALGGNTFVLARAMHASGFGPALRSNAGRAEFVYGGYSAGACVAGPDLRGIDIIDDPTVVPPDYPLSAQPVGLGLVPFRIVPHWRSEHPEAPAAEQAAAWLAHEGLSHRCLRDGQAVTRDGTIVNLR